ncbi:MAG: phosphoenolpyruvate--protein phosphotransferase [Desulfomonilaceae bacterium]
MVQTLPDKNIETPGIGAQGVPQNTILKGVGVSVGIGIGQVVLMERLVTEICPCRILPQEEIPDEIARFEEAVQKAEDRLKTIKSHINSDHPLGDHSYILDTHILLLRDKMLYEGAKQAIEQNRQNAEWALSEVMSKITAAFESIDDEYMRERARDVHFVGERLLKLLLGVSSEKKIHQLPANSILVVHDLSPADAAQIKKESVLAIATDVGGRTSHSAIMSRSLKIPAVTGLEKISRMVKTGDTIIVDGSTGLVILNPDPEMIFRYRQRHDLLRNYHQSLLAFGRLPAVTRDGANSIRILANIELVDEIDIAIAHGCEGIGLFRTEYLFLGREDLPSEEEQFEAYRAVVARNKPYPVTIRTLDIGGDKIASSLNLPQETNPAMGLRAIRLCLSLKNLFKTQLRAILRAAHYGNCRLLVPMISCITEIQNTKAILEEVKAELASEGAECDSGAKLGILVEVPSAVAIADLLAREVDFFSIGTNDLIQYSLAIDRLNEHVNYLYDTLHPAVLRLIRQVVNAGQAYGVTVAMCGEMAGDPVNVPILVGLGLDELSMNALSIPLVKKLIRSISYDDCLELTHQAFQMQSAQEIHGFLERWIFERFPGDYFLSQQ